MPIYEFLCSQCQHKTTVFQRSFSQSGSPSCPACGGQVSRLISSFAYHRSIQSVHESSGDPDRPGADYHKDPRNIGRWVEKRFQQMGMDMPSQVQDMIKGAREGDLPGAAKDLNPNLGEL
ncbi:MAG: zinc ribbon domain-containing protein [Dehalococcoidia bacterium]|nr:zinc ribbon domain-containing protein [Dehalococcoidia bacterium]